MCKPWIRLSWMPNHTSLQAADGRTLPLFFSEKLPASFHVQTPCGTSTGACFLMTNFSQNFFFFTWRIKDNRENLPVFLCILKTIKLTKYKEHQKLTILGIHKMLQKKSQQYRSMYIASCLIFFFIQVELYGIFFVRTCSFSIYFMSFPFVPNHGWSHITHHWS